MTSNNTNIFGIYNNLSQSDIVALSYLSAINSWGISENSVPSIPNQCGCIPNYVAPIPTTITWATWYNIWNTVISKNWNTIE